MEVLRITPQSELLEDHYSRLANDSRKSPDYAELGRRMLELLRLLSEIDGPPVWAVTSHADLHLLGTDDYRQQSLLTIRGGGFGEGFSFGVEYQMPEREAHWPGSRVLLGTHDTSQACEMVAYGLSKATGVAYTYRKACSLPVPTNLNNVEDTDPTCEKPGA